MNRLDMALVTATLRQFRLRPCAGLLSLVGVHASLSLRFCWRYLQWLSSRRLSPQP